MFRRRHSRRRAAAPGPAEVLGAGVTSVVVTDPTSGAAGAEAWRALRRIAAEALILQDAAEERLVELRDERDLGAVAPPLGDLIGRFATLRAALPGHGDPAIERHVDALRAILDHHVLVLDGALGMLASEWRSERIGEQLDRITGLGAPARRLERVRAEILDTAPV